MQNIKNILIKFTYTLHNIPKPTCIDCNTNTFICRQRHHITDYDVLIYTPAFSAEEFTLCEKLICGFNEKLYTFIKNLPVRIIANSDYYQEVPCVPTNPFYDNRTTKIEKIKETNNPVQYSVMNDEQIWEAICDFLAKQN